MPRKWEIDAEKFSLPADRGDIVLLAIRMQRIIVAISGIESALRNNRPGDAKTSLQALEEVKDSLEEMQISLAGKEAVSDAPAS